MDISANNRISKQAQLMIYNLVCIEKVNDEEIEDYCDYEANGDPGRQVVIREAARACKVFMAKCMLTKVEIPKPEEIVFECSSSQIKVNQEIRIKHVGTPKPLHQQSDQDDDDDTI